MVLPVWRRRFQRICPVVVIAASGLLTAGPFAASAQVPDVGEGVCVANCDGGRGGGSSGGGGSAAGAYIGGVIHDLLFGSWDGYRVLTPPGSSTTQGPSPQQQAHARAMALNREGLALARQGRYAEANEKYREAYASDPSDKTDQSNFYITQSQMDVLAGDLDGALRAAKQAQALGVDPGASITVSDVERLIAERNGQNAQRQAESQAAAREAARQQAEQRAATQINQSVNRLAASLRSSGSSESSSGLGFMAVNDKQTAGGNTAFFGKGGPSHPAVDSSKLTTATVASNAEALSSAAKSSQDATTRNDEVAKNETGCQFDQAGCQKPDAVSVPQVNGKTPAVAMLLSHIPPQAMNDPKIKTSVEWYQRREADRIEVQGQLADVQKQIDSGEGDTTVLTAQKQTLANQLGQIEQDQQTATQQIKKTLVDDGLSWNESAQPDGATAKP